MSQDAIEQLLGRLITDDDFRERAKEAFTETCWEEGIFLTEEEARIVLKTDFGQFVSVAESLDKQIRRSRKFREIS